MNRHVAPLIAFVLLLVFVAILAFTGLMGRRLAEILILLGGAAFMIQRLFTRRQFCSRSARRAQMGGCGRTRRARSRPVSTTTGSTFENPSLSRRWRFADAREYEDAGGMIYLWPKGASPPAFFPTRAFADEAEAARWRGFARARIGARLAPSREEDDD